MRIDQLPELPSGVPSVDVPVTFAGADYRMPLTPSGDEQAPVIGFVDDANARANITIGSNHYVRIDPPSLPSGARLVAVSALACSSVSGAFSISPYGNVASYLFADNGTTINGLRCRFWYVTGV